LGFGGGLTTAHSKKLIVTKVEQWKSWKDLTLMERVGDRWEKMDESCSTGQSPQWAVVPVEEEENTCINAAGNAQKRNAKENYENHCQYNTKKNKRIHK
jgi:hypothetical protein